jgi:hypothetical protein
MAKGKRVYSLGYEGSKPPIIRNILIDNQITHLIDIRRDVDNARGRFNKERIKALCEELTIDYIHEQELAPSKALIKEAKQREQEIKTLFPGRKKIDQQKRVADLTNYYQGEFKRKYLEEIKGQKTLATCLTWMQEFSRPCFFCYERYSKKGTSPRTILIDFIFKQYKEILVQTRRINLHEKYYRLGMVYDLEEAFGHVNRHYYDNRLLPDEMVFSWTTALNSGKKRFTFGQFRPPNTILMNASLDSKIIPEFFINAVFYHEIIHYRLFRDGKKYGHTTDFYIEEWDFKEAGKDFHFTKRFMSEVLPELKSELDRAKIGSEDYDQTLKPIMEYLSKIMGDEDNDDEC